MYLYAEIQKHLNEQVYCHWNWCRWLTREDENYDACNNPRHGIIYFHLLENLSLLFTYIQIYVKRNIQSGLLIVPLLSIPQEYALCDLLGSMSVCLSICPYVLTITQERLEVEWWSWSHIYVRSKVTWSSKMGHVHDLFDFWPGQIENFHNVIFKMHSRLHNLHVHVPVPVLYLYICASVVC